MAHPLHLVIAVTGFLVLTVLGLRLIIARPVPKRRLPYASEEEYRALARVALEAELREPRYLEDAPEGLPEGRFDGHGGSVFCRSCLRDFPAGTPYCKKCGDETADPEEIAAAWMESDAAALVPDELIVVHVANSPVQASLLKMYLESHDIECLTQGHVPSSVYHFNITPLGEVQILVRSGDATRARSLLLECR